MLAVFSAVGLQAAELTVRWNDNSSDETGFRIERSTDGDTFTEVATVAANVTVFVDTGLSATTTYWYRIQAYNATGTSAFSNVAGCRPAPDTVSDSATAPAGRLVNLSVRAVPGQGEQTLIVGFIVAGASKSILLRGVGPSLAAYTTAPVFSDPTLKIQAGDLPILSNDNWGGTDLLKDVFGRVGAFPLADASRDAVLFSDFTAGGYTALVGGSGSGLVLAEIYDADVTSDPPGRLANISARAVAGTGDSVLIVGFVIGGNAPMHVLVRAVGPTLANYGVTGALADPQLELFRRGVQWDHNDNWEGDARLESAFDAAGAAAWPNPSSKDAALTALLPPGAYTAVVSGRNGASGVALAEVYELR